MTKDDLKAANFPCIMPTVKDDYLRGRAFYNRLFDTLPIRKLIFICPNDAKEVLMKDISSGLYNDNKVEFLSEQDLLPIDTIRPIYDELLSKSHCPMPSTIFWYYQQFLKMSYAKVCQSEYYLSWDSDTIPLHKIEMISPEGLPYFDIKSECQKEYFVTIERLFGFSKIIEKSFISEHMLFNKEYMMEIIKEIEATDFAGSNFAEKILFALGSDNIKLGFSEFETFGTWVGMNHPSAYKLRNWKSIRNTSFFTDISDITQDDLDWLATSYDAATFEKYQETEPALTDLFRNPRYREKLTAEQFYISILESGAMGEYNANGTVLIDGFVAPT